MIKPVVHYVGKPQFYVWEWAWAKDIEVANIPEVIDHPILGHRFNIRTSQVVKPIDSDGKFETLNTIYEPYQDS